MNFEKINNRYKLKPLERIKKLVKHEKEISISRLQRETGIQLDVLKKHITTLSNEGLLIEITDTVINEEDKTVVSVSRTIK